jgi:hypothetical protein
MGRRQFTVRLGGGAGFMKKIVVIQKRIFNDGLLSDMIPYDTFLEVMARFFRIRTGWIVNQLTQDVCTGFIRSCLGGKRGKCRFTLNSEQGMTI